MRRGRAAFATALIPLLLGCGRVGYDGLTGDGGASSPGGDAADPEAPPTSDGGAAAVDGARRAPDAATAAPDAGAFSGSVTIAIGRDGDDGLIEGDRHLPGGHAGVLDVGRSAGTTAWGHVRFPLPEAIPAGATVDHVHLSVTSGATSGWDEASYRLAVFAENEPDAQVVGSGGARPDGTAAGLARRITDANVLWPETGGLTWSSGVRRSSPELAPLIQELVDRHGGLAAGAHVQIWIRGDGYSVDATAGMRDSSHGGGGPPPELVLEWTAP